MEAENHMLNVAVSGIHDMVMKSGLHFAINQTPFSSYIMIRRRFTNPELHRQFGDKEDSSKDRVDKLTLDKKELKVKNEELEEALVQNEEAFNLAIIEADNRLANVHLIAEKLKIESDRLKGEKAILENVIKKHQMEVTEQKNRINQLSKSVKIKEKEIYNLKNKDINQQDAIKQLKDGIKKMKNERSKLEKQIQKLKQKPVKEELRDYNENVKETETIKECDKPAHFDPPTNSNVSLSFALSSSTPPLLNINPAIFSTVSSLTSSASKTFVATATTFSLSTSPAPVTVSSNASTLALTSTTSPTTIWSRRQSVADDPEFLKLFGIHLEKTSDEQGSLDS